jgi:hypothetical protein
MGKKKKLKGRDHPEDLEVDGRTGWKGMDWMHLAQNKNQ